MRYGAIFGAVSGAIVFALFYSSGAGIASAVMIPAGALIGYFTQRVKGDPE
ncbi:MAG: hypothetical protein LBG62_04420 [Candidatus Methanoplasma sp.]|jgi:hypothetical protein|nr:hypothetical protein [Candidatus Methanoplasma sp.]